MLTYLFMKIVTHIFGYKICSIPNIFEFKILLNPYYWVSFEPSICTPLPPWGNKPEGVQDEHLKKLNELLQVSLNSMYGLKIPAGDRINPKKCDKPLKP